MGTRTVSLKDGLEDTKEFRAMEEFFGRTWSKWMNKNKIVNIIIFFIIFVVTAIFGFQIQGQDETENIFMPSSWWNILETVTSDFGTSEFDDLESAQITYGISGVDRSDVKQFSLSTYSGEIIWDDEFEMYTTEQQEYLYTACQILKNSTMAYESPNSEFVTCPIEEWINYLTSISEGFPYDAGSKSAFAEMWYNFLASDYAEDTISYKLSYVED